MTIKSLNSHFYPANFMSKRESCLKNKNAATLRAVEDGRKWYLIPISQDSEPEADEVTFWDKYRGGVFIGNRGEYLFSGLGISVYKDNESGIFLERHIYNNDKDPGKPHHAWHMVLPEDFIWEKVVPLYDSEDTEDEDWMLFGRYEILTEFDLDDVVEILTPDEGCDTIGHHSTTITEKEETMSESNVAAPPVPGRSRAKKKKAAKKRTTPRKSSSKATSSSKRARKKVVKEGLLGAGVCSCGCGGATGGYFVPGHDARHKGHLLKIERGKATKEDILTAEVIAAYKWVKVKGVKGGERPTKNYKGEPHSGYVTD